MASRTVAVLAVLAVLLGHGQAYNNGKAMRPPLGWNTWCTNSGCSQPGVGKAFHDICNETEIQKVAQAMVSSGLKDAGFHHINLDDCWVGKNRDENGNLQPDPLRFPSGMKAIADYVHSLGLEFGLYTSAGATTCNGGGTPTPSGGWPRNGSLNHYKEDTALFASWGVDYVKIDWCGDMSGFSSEVLHTNFSHWLNATGRHIHLELCRGYETRPIEPYVAKVANSWRVTGDNADLWSHTIAQIGSFINQSALAGPYNWNYGDFLMTGGAGCGHWDPGAHCPGQTDAEYRTQFGIYAIVASPLIVGTDIRNLTSVMRATLLNTAILAVNQDYEAPAGDWVASFSANPRGEWERSTAMPEDADAMLFARHLTDGSVAVGLINLSDKEIKMDLDFSLWGWKASTTARVQDLWAHSGFGPVSGGVHGVTVASHDTSMLRITPSSP